MRGSAVALEGAALITAAIGILGCDARAKPENLVVADPASAVAEARKLIAARRSQADPSGPFVQPASLPASLQVPGLRYAHVHEDHVDLVLARNPDCEVGGRIWAQSHRRHEDERTRYAEIYFYGYCNDFAEAPDNIR